jgi:hypothetical protein
MSRARPQWPQKQMKISKTYAGCAGPRLPGLKDNVSENLARAPKLSTGQRAHDILDLI